MRRQGSIPESAKAFQFSIRLPAPEMDDWFSSLWHGKQLGFTLAFLSVGTAAGCFFFAQLLSFTPDADQAENRDV
jgi:hypothetical protein